MCLAMEKKEKKDRITGAIQGMRIAGMTDDDILIKVMEAFHVTREYVLAILKAHAA